MKGLIKHSLVLAAVLLTGCVSYSQHELPAVQTWPPTANAPADKPTAYERTTAQHHVNGGPVNAAVVAQVVQWENLLNAPGARESLVARWLYEHLFLAHIYFKDGEPGHFFQWVRSRTPTGQPINLIASRRPKPAPNPGACKARQPKATAPAQSTNWSADSAAARAGSKSKRSA